MWGVRANSVTSRGVVREAVTVCDFAPGGISNRWVMTASLRTGVRFRTPPTVAGSTNFSPTRDKSVVARPVAV